MRTLRNVVAVVRILVFIVWTLFLIPLQVGALLFRSRFSWLIPQLYHRGNCLILGLKITVYGMPEESRAVLFVANHSSYLDIIILAALIQARFVSKREVASWPIFGFLAKLNRTVFVNRRRRESGRKLDEMKNHLTSGERLILFPEGTSNDGNRVLKFNSTFFAAADTTFDGTSIKVQPVAISYTRLWGLPMGRGDRPLRAWYGDMKMAGHLWAIFTSGPTDVEVAFLPAVVNKEFPSRKDMAQHCEHNIASAVSNILGGKYVNGVNPHC